MSDDDDVYRSSLDGTKLDLMGIPGDHVLFRRRFDDESEPDLYTFFDAELEWAAQELQYLAFESQRDTIETGDECPICGDECVNAYEALAQLEGESVEVEKICVVEFPHNSIIHISDDRVNPEGGEGS